jgi:hypothetical protein
VSQSDIRLHSQVALFIILTRIYHAFGPDVDVEVADGDLVRIERFDADIESWRRVWEPRLGSVHLLDASGRVSFLTIGSWESIRRRVPV